MAPSWAFLGDVAEDVTSWLDACHLGRLEAAGKAVDKEVIGRCWGPLAEMERSIVECRPWFLQVLPTDATGDGKEAVKELFKMRLQLNTIPSNWSPEITSISPSSLRVLPHLKGLANSDGAGTDPPRVPPFASVPLALGITLGDEMAIGLRVQSKGGRSHEGVWLALEITGEHDGHGSVVSVLCAPLTGRCLMTFPGESQKLVTNAFRPLADHLCDSVDIFVTVSESGDVEFVRICEASNSIDRSGKMLCETLFPCWAHEVYASVEVQMEHILSETTVTTKRPARDMLQEQHHLEAAFEFDGTWSILE